MDKNEIFEKIYWNWKKLESKERKTVEREILDIETNAKFCFGILEAHLDKYEAVYDNASLSGIKNIPNIAEFFKSIKTISKEAYEFITDGYDMEDLRTFLALRNKYMNDVVDTVFGFLNYSRYISYAFMKVLKEENEDKKRNLLKGMLGL